MKKVGIITFHNALNYGATLQAYALCRFLNDNGYEAEVLNYVNPKMQKEIKVWYPFLHLSRPVDRLYGLMKIPLRIRQKHMFDRFINERMNISGPIVSSANSLNAFLDMYDVFIAGSDQVFNFNGTGEDYNFFLQFEFVKFEKLEFVPARNCHFYWTN